MGDSTRPTASRSSQDPRSLMKHILGKYPGRAKATQSHPAESSGDNTTRTTSRSRVSDSDYGTAHNLTRSDTIQSDNWSTPARHAESVSIQNSTEPDDDHAHITQLEDTTTSNPSAAQETDSIAKDVESAVSLPQATPTLWDEAYESLKSQQAELLERYEILLTFFLQGNSKGEQRRRNSESGASDSIIASSNPLRKQQMNNIISLFLGKYQDKDSNSDTKGSGNYRQMTEIIASVICYSPEAVLPWAGTCLSAHVCAGDSHGSERVTKGLGHIISRMAWYTILPKLLDSSRDDDLNGEYQAHDQSLLKNKILELYKQVLLYQIRIACSEKNNVLEETPFRRDVSSVSAVRHLDETEILLAETALANFQNQDVEEKIRKVIENNGIETVPASCDDEEFAMEKAEVQTLLKDLNEIYPFKERLTMGDEQSETLSRLFRWVCSTPEYNKFREASGGALWVSCSPITGTVMIMRAITYGLSNELTGNPKLGCILLSFGKHDWSRPENNTVVVKRLISLLLEQQPWLVNHLVEKCESTKRKYFSDREDFYALSLVFLSMLQDDRFNSTLFLLDGTDEIDDIDHPLDSLRNLIFTTMTLSIKVKWLISINFTDTIAASHPKDTDKNFYLQFDLGNQQAIDAFENSYIPSKISELRKSDCDKQSFYEGLEKKLSQVAYRDFLWADIAYEAVKLDDIWHASEFLEQLSKQQHTSADSLFKFMKNRIKMLPGKEPEFCQNILFTLVGTYRPLHINELEALVGLPPEVDVKVLIQKRCFAFLEICGDTVHFRNRLARSFLEADMKELHPKQHLKMLELCLDYLSQFFKTSSSRLHSQQYDGLTKPTNYATVYWVKHLHDAGGIGGIKEKVESFLIENLLNWLDLLVESGLRTQVWAMTRELQTHQEFNPDIQALGENDDGDNSARNFLSRIREAQELIRLHDLTETPKDISITNTLLFSSNTSLMRQDFLPAQIAVAPITKQSWHRIAHILQGHTDYVRCCAYSHDGKYLASGSDDQTVRIWNTSTGKVQHIFQRFRGWVYRVEFSCKGLIAATDAATIRVWDVATGVLQKSLDDGPLTADTIDDLAFSPDGTMLAALVNGDIFIMSLPSYSIVVQQRARYRSYSVSRLRFFQGNTLLGTISGPCVSIWELSSTTSSEINAETETEADAESKPSIKAGAHTDMGKSSSEETRLSEAKGQELQLELRKNLLLAKDTSEWAVGLSFSHDSRFVATGTDERYHVYVWEWQSEKDPSILKGHTSPISAVSFARDDKYIASASEDKTSRVWETPRQGSEKSATLILKGDSRSLLDASFSPSQDSLATCSSDGSIWIWDYDGSKESREQKPADGEATDNQPISIVTISKDGQLIASGSSQGIICLWDGESGIFRRKLVGHEREVESLTFSSDSNRIVSASDDRTARVWDTHNGIEAYKLVGHGDWVRAAVFSPDGNLVASGSDDWTVRVWDTRGSSGETKSVDSILTLRAHMDYVRTVAFSHDGKCVASGGDDGRVFVWQLASTAPPRPMDGIQESRIEAVIFVEDSRKLICSLSERICIWNSETGDHIGLISTNYTIRTMQLATDPQYLMTNMGPLQLENVLKLQKADIARTSWSPYGITSNLQYITWKGDKIIYLPKRYRPANDRLSVCAWGHKVVIGCSSGELLLFSFKEAAVFTGII